MQVIRLLMFGFGSFTGGIISSLTEKFYTPYQAFFVLFLICIGMLITCIVLPDDIETNEYAMIADENEEKYITQKM